MIGYGVDSNGKIVPLLLDASGRVIVSAVDLTTGGSKFNTNLSGTLYVAGEEPSSLNPTGILANFSTLTLAAGSSVLTIYTIPTGQRMRFTQCSYRYTGTVAGVKIELFVTDGSTLLYFHNSTVITNALFVPVVADITLEAGWIIKATVIGATLNDDFVMSVGLQRCK